MFWFYFQFYKTAFFGLMIRNTTLCKFKILQTQNYWKKTHQETQQKFFSSSSCPRFAIIVMDYQSFCLIVGCTTCQKKILGFTYDSEEFNRRVRIHLNSCGYPPGVAHFYPPNPNFQFPSTLIRFEVSGETQKCVFLHTTLFLNFKK